MRRVLIVLVSLGLVVLTWGTADAGKNARLERTVRGSYGAYPTPVTGCNSAMGPWACLTVTSRPAEAFFSAEVADAHGQPVLVNVYSEGGHVASFCGRTRRSIAITPGSTLEFDIGQGRAPFTPLPCPERVVKSTGTITVTLSNRR